MPTTTASKKANQPIKVMAKDGTVYYNATIIDPLHLREDQQAYLADLKNWSYKIKIKIRWDSMP